DQVEDEPVGLAAREQLDGRNADSFLVVVARTGAVTDAANVGEVRHGERECNKPAAAEHRLHQVDVIDVAGPDPRIIGQEHVAVVGHLHRHVVQHAGKGGGTGAGE